MSPRTEAGKRYGFYVDPDEDHPRRSGDAYNTVWHAIDAIEAEARAQALEEVRAGVAPRLERYSRPDGYHRYGHEGIHAEVVECGECGRLHEARFVLALLDRLSKGTA